MYKKASSKIWNGRIDNGENTKRWHEKIKFLIPPFKSKKGIVFLGFECDEGVKRNNGRAGAKDGSNVLKQAMGNFSYHQENTPLYDAGSIVATKSLDESQNELAKNIVDIMKQKHLPIILGGGHETAYGSFLALSKAIKKEKNIAIINFDAHFDLREDKKSSSGTPFLQIANLCKKEKRQFNYFVVGISRASNTKVLFKTAKELNVKYILDTNANWLNFKSIFKKLDEFLEKKDFIYISIDTDVFIAYSVPCVSAMAGRGIEPSIAYEILKYIIKNYPKKLALVDIVEFSPRFDINKIGEKTVARIIYDIVDLVDNSK